jgi:hypothetical protein
MKNRQGVRLHAMHRGRKALDPICQHGVGEAPQNLRAGKYQSSGTIVGRQVHDQSFAIRRAQANPIIPNLLVMHDSIVVCHG